jgi:hypothetical protein
MSGPKRRLVVIICALAPWHGMSSWLSFHLRSTPQEWLVRPGQVVVSSPSFVKCRPPFHRCSTCDPPHKQLLVRLGQVVHRHLLSIVIVPSHLSFPCCLLFVVPLIVCCLHRHTALVHPQSTRRAVARQRGGGCSVDHRHHHCCHPCCCHSSSLFIVIPIVVIHHSSSLSLLSSFIIHHCCPCHRHSLFIVVPVHHCHHHPCHHHSLSTRRLFFFGCPPSPRSTCSPPYEQLLMRLGAGGGVVVGAGGSRFKVRGERGSLVIGGLWLGWFVLSPAVISSLDPRNKTKELLDQDKTKKEQEKLPKGPNDDWVIWACAV